MKDYNDLMNELDSLLEFANDEENGYADQFVYDLEEDIKVIEDAVSKIKSLENTDIENLKLLTGKSENEIKAATDKRIKDQQELIMTIVFYYRKDLEKMNNAKRVAAEKAKEAAKAKADKRNRVLKTAGVGVLATAVIAAGAGGLSNITTSMKNARNTEKSKDGSSIEETTTKKIQDNPIYDEKGNLVGFYNPETNTIVKVESSEPEVTTTETEEVVEEAKFNDINDSIQVEERVGEILADLDAKNPGHDFTEEEVENWLMWVNGGAVKGEITRDSQLFVVNRIYNVLNRDNQGESKENFDISLLFLDNTQGQKLAKMIQEYRNKLREVRFTEEVNEVAKEFTFLWASSWKFNGSNNIPSVYALETPGMQMLNDMLFLNTYASQDSIKTEVEVNGVIVNLDELADECNLRDCKTELTTDDGQKVQATVDKFSKDMNDAYTSALYNKENDNKLALNR